MTESTILSIGAVLAILPSFLAIIALVVLLIGLFFFRGSSNNRIVNVLFFFLKPYLRKKEGSSVQGIEIVLSVAGLVLVALPTILILRGPTEVQNILYYILGIIIYIAVIHLFCRLNSAPGPFRATFLATIDGLRVFFSVNAMNALIFLLLKTMVSGAGNAGLAGFLAFPIVIPAIFALPAIALIALAMFWKTMSVELRSAHSMSAVVYFLTMLCTIILPSIAISILLFPLPR